MKAPEIRQAYLDFFRSKDHVIVPSAPVVPHDDPTLLFTNAGMNQFKPFFLGQATPEHRRIADTQKCIRVSGKHNDLEETGYDTYHHTFFEMLGNWSIGDYYKKEAIAWAWEFLTEVVGLPKDRLYFTVFEGDDRVPKDEEAIALIKQETDIDPSHIIACGAADNFWMMGETGPCGPCSEIHIDLTPDKSGGSLVNADDPRVMEIWNLVFIQFNAEENGDLRPLPLKHIDTGMGFERLCAVLECTDQGRDFSRPVSNYDTEVFQPLIRELESLSQKSYTKGLSSDKESVAMRVCADHVRMISCAIADGALPSNEGRGYVVRRLLRRASRYGRNLGLTKPFLYQLVAIVVDTLGGPFPELKREQARLEKIIEAEESSFLQTLERGVSLYEEIKSDLKAENITVIPGEVAFKLYDTYGFPVDLTAVMAKEDGLTVDMPGFESAMAEQKERARAAQKKTVVSALDEDLNLSATTFVGYNQQEVSSKVLAALASDEGLQIVVEATPFYAEKGGQLADTGTMHWETGHGVVLDTQDKEGVIFHQIALTEGSVPEVGNTVSLKINEKRRVKIAAHHTATHLLHWALRKVLGTDVRQQGSSVGPERLRFDFTHFESMTPDELRQVEDLVNEAILENHKVSWFEIDYAEKPDSVLAFFGDKYGDKVRVVKIGGEQTFSEPIFDGFSMELCGGTHVEALGELGLIKISSESAIAAGVRRIEAVSANAAYAFMQEQNNLLQEATSMLKTSPAELTSKIEQLLQQQKELEKKVKSFAQMEAKLEADRLLEAAEGKSFLVGSFAGRDGGFLKGVAEALKSRYDGAALLVSAADDKVVLQVIAGKQAQESGFQAGKAVSELAKIVGGGGGGRPDFAQAGGKDATQVPAMVQAFEAMF